jgi:threonylcarbamoyladenosine tRNA methylthiotransferase MtaB
MIPFKTAAYYTLGCKLNFAETSGIAKDLEAFGLARVNFDEVADIYVINTCSVTENANRKCRNIVRKAKKQNPDSKVIVIGCYAQLKPKEIADIEGVNLVLGANEKFNIPRLLEDQDFSLKTVLRDRISEVNTFHLSYSSGDRTRSFLKVQDGCDYFCSFCTIPLARGKSRSARISQVVNQAEELGKMGYKEVVLTGVNTGDFGSGTDENFYKLIQALEHTSVPRYRVSSVEPNLLTNEIIKFMSSSKKFVPHFHIPLQSGSDLLLKSMKRKYDTDYYKSRVLLIKTLMPEASIGIDVIVGYPCETEKEFSSTLEFLKDIEPAYLHVFSYSERLNTAAIRMDGKVSQETKAARSGVLRMLSDKFKRSFYQKNINTYYQVLWEGQNEENLMFGLTENYIKVSRPFDADRINKFESIELKTFNQTEMRFEVLTPQPKKNGLQEIMS